MSKNRIQRAYKRKKILNEQEDMDDLIADLEEDEE